MSWQSLPVSGTQRPVGGIARWKGAALEVTGTSITTDKCTGVPPKIESKEHGMHMSAATGLHVTPIFAVALCTAAGRFL